MKKVWINKNKYTDSVTLMAAAEKTLALEGVTAAELVLCTPANRGGLEQNGYTVPPDAGSNDIAIALEAADDSALDRAYKYAAELLAGGGEKTYSSLDEIDMDKDPYDLVQISLPGEYAVAEAEKAVRKGLDVFIFSDNVNIGDELKLKRLGEEKGRLVMGPDCGVGLMGGVALAAGSIVNQGTIGIVGASGSGAQEVACIIEKCGLGVSCIIGTGGRDLYPEIGGITMLAGIERLEKDAGTKVIVLVSKLADSAVMAKVLDRAERLSKPVVAVFLGSSRELFKNRRVKGAFNLEEAALLAVKLAGGTTAGFALPEDGLAKTVSAEVSKYKGAKPFLRGLFCGGTFTEESLIYYSAALPELRIYSNLKTKYAVRLTDPLISEGHTVLDLGAENFTKDAPHPVFDPELRLKRFRTELKDAAAAIFTLDFITGPGVHADPITPFAKEIRNANRERNGKITVIANICGSVNDPQDIKNKSKLLKECGAIVTPSNYQSTRLAAMILRGTEGFNG